MTNPFFKRKDVISGEIIEKSDSGNVAKKRLISAINCERTHINSDISMMMQQDIRKVIESYLGTDLESSDLILEIKAPEYTSFVINSSKSVQTENNISQS